MNKQRMLFKKTEYFAALRPQLQALDSGSIVATFLPLQSFTRGKDRFPAVKSTTCVIRRNAVQCT